VMRYVMSEKKPSVEQPTGKVCEMIFSHDSESQEFKDLVKDPIFICSQCGNTAGRAESLCRPERM